MNLFTSLRSAGLLALTTAVLPLTTLAAPGPARSSTRSAAAHFVAQFRHTTVQSTGTAQRATDYTRYLTQALHLFPHQFLPVYHCTLQQLTSRDSLAAQPAAVVADYVRLEERYEAAMHPLLSAGQFNAFVLLRERQPEDRATSTIAVKHN
jgi:polysaccharide pyruvyl transferase WcaK-like protein